jgi:hypothetical protein
MSKQAWIGIGVVVVAAILGGVLLTTSDKSSSNVDGAATSSSSFSPELITAAHQYNEDEDLHIVAGETDVPTACHLLSTDVTVAESDPEQVTINFTSSLEDPEAVCAQVITGRRFKTTFQASEAAEIDATYNGQAVELNLQEVGPDENLEEFEVYTKG